MDFIVINLAFFDDGFPSDTENILNWADDLLQEFSDHRAILVTHWLIDEYGSWGYPGSRIWESLKDRSNLFLMLCGHDYSEGRREDIGDNGNTVDTLLANYQDRSNGGNGWLRIMEFSPDYNVIRVKTYSPWLDEWERDADSEFTLNYDMGGDGNVVEVRVNESSDDAEESASGSMRLTSSDLELVNDGSDQTVGIRFSGVAIPQNANIVHAYVQFQVDETSSVSTTLTIEGEAIDDAPTFTSSGGNISSRVRTWANVPWSPLSWTTKGAAGPDQRTPDISQIIKEIVEQPGWSSSNSLALIITGTGERVAESYNGDQNGAPLLHVEYTTGTPINQPPVVDAGADETIILPVNTLDLDATCTDDGLPDGTLNFHWSQVSGPDTVTFDDDSAEDTTATFPASGVYVLRLTADDTELFISDDIQVTVCAEPINLAPEVDAGANQTITLPVDNVLLEASATDDGLPSGVLTTEWSQFSGPASQVVFDDAYAVETTARFLSAETYVLQLTADDGELTDSDQVTITVNEGGNGAIPLVSNLTVKSGKAYQVVYDGLENGTKAYIDRSYYFTSIPADLQGATYIRTANDDKSSTGDDFLSFEVNREVTVYVAHDDLISVKPDWLQNFTDRGDQLVNTDKSLSLFMRDYPAGPITLGGNEKEGSGHSMYVVVLVSQVP